MIPFDTSKPAFESSLVSSEVLNNFLAIHYGDASPLRPRASSPLAMTVNVGATTFQGYWMQTWYALNAPLNFAGGDSPVVVAPSTNPRIDLLKISSAGVLSWTVGAEAASPAAPTCPETYIPIAYVYMKTTMTKIVNFEDQETYPSDGYIYRDIRPFLTLFGNIPNIPNVTISAAGLCPIAPNDVQKFFRGDATWALPTGFARALNGLHDADEVSTGASGWTSLKYGDWFYKKGGFPSRVIGTLEAYRSGVGAATAARIVVGSVVGSGVDCNDLAYTQKSITLDISSLGDGWYRIDMQGDTTAGTTHYQKNHIFRLDVA